MTSLPESLLQQFRTIALQRLDRIEVSWAEVLAHVNDHAAAELHREVHTLKGESRVLGFHDINVVCHKLEDLLEVARAKGYAVDDDFDLSVNMALRFLAMLARKKLGSQLGGIDLPGFVKQIDQLLAEAGTDRPPRTRTGSMPVIARPEPSVRVPLALRPRLAPTAIDAFIEYAAATGSRRERLRGSWHTLRELLGVQRAIISEAQLAKHEAGALALARDLGKVVEVAFEIATTEVPVEVLAAIDEATLHLVRNAVDHGIEPPSEREAAGKQARGLVRIAARLVDESFVLVVQDDGRGIKLDAVRARAVEAGFVSAALAPGQDLARLVEFMVQPGFSTTTAVSDVSGRGVGLDAVRTRVSELGGTLAAASSEGGGTLWTVTVPVPVLTVHALALRAPGVPFPIVIAGQLVDEGSPPQVDIAAALGLSQGTPTAFGITDAVTGVPWRVRTSTGLYAVLCEHEPQPVTVRRLVIAPPTAIGEVVLLDSVDALLLRPERLGL